METKKMEAARNESHARLLRETLAGLVILALVTVGAGMSVYRLIAPGGWIAYLFGRSLPSDAAAMVSLFVIGVGAVFSRAWFGPARKNRYAELVMYGFAGAGMLYCVQLIVTYAF